jgi:hypothetical protein
LLEEFATSVFNVDGQLSEKPGPGSPTGDNDGDSFSIKNYPRFTRTPQDESDDRSVDKGVDEWKEGFTVTEGEQTVSATFFEDPPEDDPTEERAFLSELV